MILSLIVQMGYSQKLKIDSDQKVLIDTIVSIDSVSVQNIYNAVKKWGASNFNNLKEVTVLDTPEEIQFRFIQQVSNGMAMNSIYTTLNIKIKEGKFKAEYSNLSWVGQSATFENSLVKEGKFRDNKPSRQMISSTEENFKSSISSLSKQINSKTEEW